MTWPEVLKLGTEIVFVLALIFLLGVAIGTWLKGRSRPKE